MKKTLSAIIFFVLLNSKTTYASNLPDCNENINRSDRKSVV